ncbi:MAG: TIGR03546 family protein [Desulfobacteraceae bacterium]|nr:MAG: TIGR03546 family protein [Desulfobacteraceae bacterium]
MITTIAKILKVLNSETDPAQIGLAVSFSLITGLTPLLSLHNLVVLFLVLALRVNISIFIVGTGLFSGISYLLDPVFHKTGLGLLTAVPLEGFWTMLYNSPVWRIERFNNSIVMGSLFISIILFVPALIFSMFTVRQYRAHILERVRKTRIMQMITASRIYSAYQAVSGWGGNI